jgi:DNA invertase Pin-like site-specific DNA recombinase
LVGEKPSTLCRYCRRHCEERGYEIAKTYTVHGKSAFKGEQDPSWRRVVKDVKAGKIQVVVIWLVDRLDRQNISSGQK